MVRCKVFLEITAMKQKILIVVGTRPNFIKVTQFEKAFASYPEHFEYRLLHTGQHYDPNMSKVFFEQLKLREPDYYLGISQGTPAAQMGEIMIALSGIFAEWRPDLVIVVGDVNSTFAAALTANKHNIKIAHLESGLRSNDREMPEEINRILTDKITDHFFITEQSGWDHLRAEGKGEDQMHFVGNTMIDTLVAFDEAIQASPIGEQLGITNRPFVLMTMHRPSNVDHEEGLQKLLTLIRYICVDYTLVFPIHPRTTSRFRQFGLWEELNTIENLILGEPMDYLAFQKLISDCAFVLTDSGGIQEETTFRQVPCLTLRENTERPVTIILGTNELAKFELDELKPQIDRIRKGTYKKGQIPPKWDGKATERIVEVLKKVLVKNS